MCRAPSPPPPQQIAPPPAPVAEARAPNRTPQGRDPLNPIRGSGNSNAPASASARGSRRPRAPSAVLGATPNAAGMQTPQFVLGG